MPNSKIDLIMHPVRSRIMAAMMQRRLTTQQLAEMLPDIPLPSLYRHIRTLTEGGVLEIVEEIRVNGAPVRVYAVSQDGGHVGPEELKEATSEDHLRSFTNFLGILEQMFRAYVQRQTPRMEDDPIQALMMPLYVEPGGHREFQDGLRAFLEPWHARAAEPGRERLLFAFMLFPDLPDPTPPPTDGETSGTL